MLVGLDVSAGATLGILGYGRIGRAVARRAQAFDMTVFAVARSRTPGTDEDGVTFVDTATLLAESDVVTVLTPLTPETRHLIDAAALSAMKPTAYLVNTARGGIVDEPHSSTPCTPASCVAPRWMCSRTNRMSIPHCSTRPTWSSPRTSPARARRPATPWASSPPTTSTPCCPVAKR